MALDIESNKANSNPKMLRKNYSQKLLLSYMIKNQAHKLACETMEEFVKAYMHSWSQQCVGYVSHMTLVTTELSIWSPCGAVVER